MKIYINSKEITSFEDFCNKCSVLRDIEEGGYGIVSSKDIVRDGYMHDTFNEYGMLLDEEDSGDYAFGNGAFDSDLKTHLEEKFSFLSNSWFSFDGNGIHEFESEEDEFRELTAEEESVINKEISAWADKHMSYRKASYFNYFDGSNMQSVIIESEGESYYQIVDDQDLLRDIYNALKKATLKERNLGYGKDGEANGYSVSVSYRACDPWLITLEEKLAS